MPVRVITGSSWWGQQRDIGQCEVGAGASDAHSHHLGAVVQIHHFSFPADLYEVTLTHWHILEYRVLPLIHLSLQFPHRGLKHTHGKTAFGCVVC